MKKLFLFAACLFFLTGVKAQLKKTNTAQGGTTKLTLDSLGKSGAQAAGVSRSKTSDKQVKLVTDFIKGKEVPKTKPVKRPIVK